jgi:hypothetical protein
MKTSNTFITRKDRFFYALMTLLRTKTKWSIEVVHSQKVGYQDATLYNGSRVVGLLKQAHSCLNMLLMICLKRLRLR